MQKKKINLKTEGLNGSSVFDVTYPKRNPNR